MIGIENSYPLGATPEEVSQAVALWSDRGALYASSVRIYTPNMTTAARSQADRMTFGHLW